MMGELRKAQNLKDKIRSCQEKHRFKKNSTLLSLSSLYELNTRNEKFHENGAPKSNKHIKLKLHS